MAARHDSPYAGSWYPGGRADLEGLLDALFLQSRARTGVWRPADPLGFVVPHAGPAYSGRVAAAAYRCLGAGRPRRVIVLGFSHRGGARGVALPDAASICTPLGEVALDEATASTLLRRPPFTRVPERRVCDHSVEIQLPFLQRAAPDAAVTALYVGPLEAWERDAAAEALAALWEPGTVYLASSDLTHFGRSFGYQPFPADADAASRLRELDFESIEAAGSLDPALFRESLAETGDTVCGSDPIALLLAVLARLGEAGIYQHTLDYETSGDITGDFSHCVSYGSLGYFRSGAFALNAEDGAALLDSAAATFESLRHTGRRQCIPAAGGSAALDDRRGLFVSLHQGDRLLGCVGHKDGREPLREAAAALTISAALDDPRFEPASAVSGPVDIEISVLTPMKRITGAARFRVGTHGGYLRVGAHRGLLLPQVAAGRFERAEDFLDALSRKACLGSGGWHDARARLYVFEAQILSQQAGGRASARAGL